MGIHWEQLEKQIIAVFGSINLSIALFLSFAQVTSAKNYSNIHSVYRIGSLYDGSVNWVFHRYKNKTKNVFSIYCFSFTIPTESTCSLIWMTFIEEDNCVSTVRGASMVLGVDSFRFDCYIKISKQTTLHVSRIPFLCVNNFNYLQF